VDRGCRPEAEVPGRSARGVDLRMSWSINHQTAGWQARWRPLSGQTRKHLLSLSFTGF